MTAKFRFREFRIIGSSRAGEETWFRVNPPGIAFDVGRGALPLSGVKDVFLTHGHLDHALGIPYLLSQRSLHHLPPTRIFCPTEIAAELESLIAAAQQLERSRYRYTVCPLEVGEDVDLGKDIRAEAFRTSHVVPSLGYHLWRRKSRLRPDLLGRTSSELVALKEQGMEIEEIVDDLCISYCGDTGPEVFRENSLLFEAQVLMVECTFIGADTRISSGEYGHIHLEDLAAYAAKFQNQVILLHHLSRRHRPSELASLIRQKLPELAERIHVFGLEQGVQE